MAQGKIKVKSKLPANVKHKSIKKAKNKPFTARKNAPVQKKMLGKLKIQAEITKAVNQKNEDETRSRATSSSTLQANLSKSQIAVQKHHTINTK